MLLGVSKTNASLLLSVLGISSFVSRLVVGWVTDSQSIDSVVLYTIALLVAGASTCTLPSLRSYQLLCGYQLVYGVCCGRLKLVLLFPRVLTGNAGPGNDGPNRRAGNA